MQRKNKQLYFEERCLSDIPFLVLEDAYWRPQDAHLQKHFRGKYEEANRKGNIKEYQRLQHFWRQRETWINYSLDCLLMASSPQLLTLVIGELVPGMVLSNPRLFKSDIAGLKADIGVPDFIIKGDDSLVLGEIKTDALEKSHRYSFEQYSKFMLFAALCLCSERPEFPKNIFHVIVSPDTDVRAFCNDYEQWRPSVVSGRLNVNAGDLKIKERKGRFTDFGSWKSYLFNFLGDEPLIEQNAIAEQKIQTFRDISSPELVPTYLYSWEEFANLYVRCAEQHDCPNLAVAAKRLQSLAVPHGTPGRAEGSRASSM